MEQEEWEFLGFSVYWVIGIGVAVLVVALVWAAARPTLLDMDTRAVRHSIGYVEGRNQHAREMIPIYNKATDAGQRQATLNDICASANDLAREEVARDVAAFLAEHPCSGEAK